MPSYALYMTSHPHFMKTTLTIYDITCTIFITSHALYMTSYLCCMMSHSLCVLHHTMTLTMTSNTICLWHIHLIWHHAQCYDHTTIVRFHSHYGWDYTQCIFDITQSTNVMKKVKVCHHSLYMYDTICTKYDTHPLFMTSLHFIYDVKSTISNITSNLSDHTSNVSV